MEKNQIQTLTNYSIIGIFWLNDGWVACFKNLIKIGLTDNVSEIFLFCTNYLLNQKNFDVLLKVFENLIPSIFQNLSFEKLKNGTLKILELYLIGAPLNSTIIEKNIQKVMKIFPNIIDKSISERLVFICECILKKYENVLLNENFTTFLANMKLVLNYSCDFLEIQNTIKTNDWMNFSKTNKEINFRGLINLGNSFLFKS